MLLIRCAYIVCVCICARVRVYVLRMLKGGCVCVAYAQHRMCMCRVCSTQDVYVLCMLKRGCAAETGRAYTSCLHIHAYTLTKAHTHSQVLIEIELHHPLVFRPSLPCVCMGATRAWVVPLSVALHFHLSFCILLNCAHHDMHVLHIYTSRTSQMREPIHCRHCTLA